MEGQFFYWYQLLKTYLGNISGLEEFKKLAKVL